MKTWYIDNCSHSTYPSVDSSSGPVGVSNNACGDHLYHDRRTSYPYDRRLLCMSSNGDLLSLVCSSLDDHHPLHESPRWRIGWVRHNVSNFLIHTVMSVSLSPLHSKCSTLRDLNIVRPNRTELRMAQDAQLPPPRDDLSLAKVARAAPPSSPCTCLPIYT